MEELIVLINFNDYLGGGETLLVRFSSFLQKNEIDFLAFCKAGSYIFEDLHKKQIRSENIVPISTNPNYYYLNNQNRKELVSDILSKLPKKTKIRLVTFCMRDLYSAFAVSRQLETVSISHLVLHIQDDLYLGQTLLDKIVYAVCRKRNFNGIRNINFNRILLNTLNSKNGLIVMADIISRFWNRNFKIEIHDSNIIPLPCFTELKKPSLFNTNVKKIIWIGRIVDFKIPAILAMINFVSANKEYSLSIVGDGNRKEILQYVKSRLLDDSRIDFIGQVPYQELENIVRQHSIGYGMGTSLIELAKYKLPVIIALASYDHQRFERDICGGLFYDKDKGCDGSDLVLSSPTEIDITIADMINQIESNYEIVANSCYEFAKTGYDEDTNFSRYIELIRETGLMSDADKYINIPVSSSIRSFLFNKYNK